MARIGKIGKKRNLEDFIVTDKTYEKGEPEVIGIYFVRDLSKNPIKLKEKKNGINS